MGKLGKSQMAGKCSANIHDIQVGQDNYYEKLNDKWIRCSDLNCFKQQGGTFDPNQKQEKRGRTPKEVFEYRKTLSDLAWDYAKQKATDEIKDNSSSDYVTKRNIMASVFYYGILGNQ